MRALASATVISATVGGGLGDKGRHHAESRSSIAHDPYQDCEEHRQPIRPVRCLTPAPVDEIAAVKEQRDASATVASCLPA